MAESRALGERGEGAGRRGRPALADEIRACCCSRSPTCRATTRPTAPARHDNVVLRTEGYDAGAYGEHQRVPHWDIGAELGILDIERATKISGSMFAMYRGLGRPAAAGPGAAQPRPQRRRLRGGPPADAGAHRDDGRRPGTCPSSPTRPTTSSATTCGPSPPPRCRSRRCTATRSSTAPTCRCATWRTRRASAARPGRPARTPAACCGSTSSTRSSCWRWRPTPSRPSPARRTCSPAARRCCATSGSPTASLDLCTGDLGDSAARTWDIEAYAPGVDQWLEVSSVSWFGDYQARRANIRYRPAEGSGKRHRGRPHRQRLGHGLAPHRRRLPRDPPPGPTARWRSSSRCAPTWPAPTAS